MYGVIMGNPSYSIYVAPPHENTINPQIPGELQEGTSWIIVSICISLTNEFHVCDWGWLKF